MPAAYASLIKSKALKYTLLSIAAGLIFLAGVLPGMQMQSDFPNYWLGSKLLAEGANCDSLYDNHWFQDQLRAHGILEQGKFSPFPPPTVFLFLPLTPFHPLEAKRVWMVVNLLLLFLAIRAFGTITRMTYPDAAGWVLASGLALINNLYLGQVYLLALVFLLYGWIRVRQRRMLQAGFLFGLVAAIKYFPLVMLPEWLMNRHRKLLVGFASTLLAAGSLSMVWPGIPACSEFLQRVVFAHLDGRLEGQSPFASAFQSWNALFHQLFLYDPVENPDPWVHSPLLLSVFRHGIPLAILLAGLLRARSLIRSGNTGFALAILCLSLLVASPASASYHLLLLLFPLALLIEKGEQGGLQTSQRVGLLFLLLLLTGWPAIFINKFLQPESWPVVLQFYRLWSLLLLWLTGMNLARTRS